MKRLIWLLTILSVLMLTGCGIGERVTIQNGEVGKQLTTSGLEAEIRAPGSFRMDSCYFFAACPTLVRLQVALTAKEIKIDQVFLPKSNIALNEVSFGIQYRIREDAESMNTAFDKIPSTQYEDNRRERIITAETIFSTYIERKAPEIVIATLRNYTVEQALTDVSEISDHVKKVLNKELTNTPIEITEFGFPNGIGIPPKIVMDAKEGFYAVDEDRAKRVKEYTAELEIEKQRQAVQRVRADNDIEISKKLGIPIEVYQELRIREMMADAALNGTPIAIGGMVPMMTPR